MTEPQTKLAELPRLRVALSTQLSVADDESFIRMLWALNALQTGRASTALPSIRNMPLGAMANGILGPVAIFPWELETLGNELLANGKHPIYRTFDSQSWPAIAGLIKLLRNLEDVEYGARRSKIDVFSEMGRISARQFEWQRGFANLAEFYRNAFVYGQGECSRYFEEMHGITVADMTLVGFTLMAGFWGLPAIRIDRDLTPLHGLGVNPQKIDRVISRIARPTALVRSEAAVLRQRGEAIAYKPSILRRFPCILMGPRARRMRAPLPELIANRVTSGLFYDLVDGDGSIRADYGRRFEAYAHALLSAMLSTTKFEPERSYRISGQRFDTPDILAISPSGEILLTIECKASRMGVNARFAEDPSGERGYEEIAKGVFQTWRFASHCRRGLTGLAINPAAKCLILALDDWFAARGPMLERVIHRATKLADSCDPEIISEDRRPVAFSSISELEATLRYATEESLLAAVDVAASIERRGWMFGAVHQELPNPKTPSKAYPFEDRIGELLPWWDRLALA